MKARQIMTRAKPKRKRDKIMPSIQKGCAARLRPTRITDAKTGEVINTSDAERDYVYPFLDLVARKTIETSEAYGQEYLDETVNEYPKMQPTGAAWKRGIRVQWCDTEHFLAVSRIERVIQHNLISIARSYVQNTDINKNAPFYGAKKSVLAAADKQIASLTLEQQDNGATLLRLRWKCYTRELVLDFIMPDYINRYDISKYCLPTVRYDETRKTIYYDFPFEEQLSYNRIKNKCYAAYDLGVIEPYVLSIKNHKGAMIATIKASHSLKALNNKRERLFKEKQHVRAKIDAYDALKIKNAKYERLKTNYASLSRKISNLGSTIARLIGVEIARICKKAGVSFCGGEDLSWVSEEKGSSHWVHGQAAQWARRECNRAGCGFLSLNAAKSSQVCSACGGNIRTDAGSRLLSCGSCGLMLDRDVSASRVLCSRLLSCVQSYLSKCYGSVSPYFAGVK